MKKLMMTRRPAMPLKLQNLLAATCFIISVSQTISIRNLLFPIHPAIQTKVSHVHSATTSPTSSRLWASTPSIIVEAFTPIPSPALPSRTLGYSFFGMNPKQVTIDDAGNGDGNEEDGEMKDAPQNGNTAITTSTSPVAPTARAPPSTNDSPSSLFRKSSLVSHHVAIKTRNIENAIDFYSLLGFRVESKFITGPARAAWLIHGSKESDTENYTEGSNTRIELLEVPNHMLNEPEGMKRRAMDLNARPELLGLNHFALDVTSCISSHDEDDESYQSASSCSLYNLQEWMEDLNASSMRKFGKSLRVAVKPTKRIIGRDVYEMAFLYDADGALVELLNWSGRLEQDVGDGWIPWDGKGFVV
mmetsp:Transcript_25085/g.52710  ORF Transcript_25085/g.52710 Transcript_25085/m.52710 type:complete len:360 (+) Transcript_25085:99-1178(+)